jgi:hypothetical protein
MTAIYQFLDTHFRKIYWLLVLAIVLGSALSFFVVLPVDETTMSAYVLAYWLPIFFPTALICLLSLYAVIGTFKRTRTWWGTLGYIVFSCGVTVYAFIAFLVVTFLLYGFS